MAIDQMIKLKYREEFRSVHTEAFQNWFEKLAIALHGADCFLAIRVTIGDGGLDGLTLKEGRVYQLYAPPSLGTDSSTANKVVADFNKAKKTLNNSLKFWTFVHNSSDGKVGHRTAQSLVKLSKENPSVCIEAIGIDGLWERLEKLPTDKLASLFGMPEKANKAESQIRALLKQARELSTKDKRRQAFEAMEKALAIAETEKINNLQAEVLVGLSLISSVRDGIGDKSHYFQRLQSLQNSITEAPVLVMFHRAHGAYLEDKCKLKEAESAYLSAISLASLPVNAKNCEEQLCVAQSEYVHFLCNNKRTNEAEKYVQLAEAYAKSNPEMLDGEVFQAAFNAGLHWAAKTGNEDAAIDRIHTLETSATNGYLASRIGGQLINAANNLSHTKLHRAALSASAAALRLTDKISVDNRKSFLPGALYTVAMVNFQAGHFEEALQKAKSLMDTTITPETAPIRFATTQLVSVISRRIGDIGTAVKTGELALSLAPEVDSSFMAKMNLAEALADNGQTEQALKLAQEARHLIEGRVNVPMYVQVEILGHIANYSAQLGDNETLRQAMNNLTDCPIDDEEVRKIKHRFRKRAKANIEIRKRIIEISLIGQGPNILKESLEHLRDVSCFIGDSKKNKPASKEPISSLHVANALTIAPVLRWWEDIGDDYNAAALDYDYWGRGCFAQILQNLQSFPHSLNVTIEVRTLQDIRQAIRLWSLYADFILLLWKGPTKSGSFIHMVDGEYFGPWGAGYMVALGDEFKSNSGRQRFAAFGYASWLPDDIAKFLVIEANPFLSSGRLLLVPASGVGCVSPGHGVIEQLLTEAANCIPAIHHEQRTDIEIGLLPYSQDIPLNILFDFVNNNSIDLLHMRKLLMNKTHNIRVNGLQKSAKTLELEIADTLKLLRSQNDILVNKRKLRAAEQEARISVAPFRIDGYGLVNKEGVLFSPLLTLESMGYGWKIGSSTQVFSENRYEPTEGEAIGAWLAPAKCGVSFPMIKPVEKAES